MYARGAAATTMARKERPAPRIIIIIIIIIIKFLPIRVTSDDGCVVVWRRDTGTAACVSSIPGEGRGRHGGPLRIPPSPDPLVPVMC